MATLKVTISEELTINGAERGSTRVHDVTSVTQVDSRIVTVTTSESDLVRFGTEIASGQFVAGTVKYLRISNTGTGGYLTLRVAGTGEEYFVKVEAGDSFILNNAVMDADESDSAAVSFSDIVEIKAAASTGTVVTEIFVAS